MEGIFALESKDTDKRYSFIDYILLIIQGWIHLICRRGDFVVLYMKNAETEKESVDFSLKVTFDNFPKKQINYWCSLFSKTERRFYWQLAVMCTVGIIIAHI